MGAVLLERFLHNAKTICKRFVSLEIAFHNFMNKHGDLLKRTTQDVLCSSGHGGAVAKLEFQDRDDVELETGVSRAVNKKNWN